MSWLCKPSENVFEMCVGWGRLWIMCPGCALGNMSTHEWIGVTASRSATLSMESMPTMTRPSAPTPSPQAEAHPNHYLAAKLGVSPGPRPSNPYRRR